MGGPGLVETGQGFLETTQVVERDGAIHRAVGRLGLAAAACEDGCAPRRSRPGPPRSGPGCSSTQRRPPCSGPPRSSRRARGDGLRFVEAGQGLLEAAQARAARWRGPPVQRAASASRPRLRVDRCAASKPARASSKRPRPASMQARFIMQRAASTCLAQARGGGLGLLKSHQSLLKATQAGEHAGAVHGAAGRLGLLAESRVEGPCLLVVGPGHPQSDRVPTGRCRASGPRPRGWGPAGAPRSRRSPGARAWPDSSAWPSVTPLSLRWGGGIAGAARRQVPASRAVGAHRGR